MSSTKEIISEFTRTIEKLLDGRYTLEEESNNLIVYIMGSSKYLKEYRLASISIHKLNNKNTMVRISFRLYFYSPKNRKVVNVRESFEKFEEKYNCKVGFNVPSAVLQLIHEIYGPLLLYYSGLMIFYRGAHILGSFTIYLPYQKFKELVDSEKFEDMIKEFREILDEYLEHREVVELGNLNREMKKEISFS